MGQAVIKLKPTDINGDYNPEIGSYTSSEWDNICANNKNAEDEYALRLASFKGDIDTVKKLLETSLKNGVDIHTDNDCALAYAGYKGHLPIVEYFVSNGFSSKHVNYRLTCNECSLINASRSGHLPVVEYLIKGRPVELGNGVDIHADNDSALRKASRFGHLPVVKFLTEGQSSEPTSLECRSSEPTSLKNGANIHAKDDYALRWASQNGHLPVVEYLISRGADIHAKDDEALKWASEYGNLNVVKYLIKYRSSEPISLECNPTKSGSLNPRSADIPSLFNINSLNEALICASENGNLRVVKYLIKKGADIHVNDDCSLKLASKYGHLPVVKYLINNGANIIRLHNVKHIIEKCDIPKIKKIKIILKADKLKHIDLIN